MSGEPVVLTPEDNLYYYALGTDVPKDATKAFRSESGFQGTDISAMWRIKILTQMFGPAGIGWYSEVVRYWENHEYGDHEDRVFCDVALYVRGPDGWSKPIYGTGGNRMWTWRWKDDSKSEKLWIPNDDCYKMAETDAFGSACKKLGIGGKVYWSQDKSKYTMLEDGTIEAGEMTNREALMEQFKAQENARNLAKQRKVQKDADVRGAEVVATEQIGDDKVGEKMAEHYGIDIDQARKAIILCRNRHTGGEPNPIIQQFMDDHDGTFMATWSPTTIIECYKALVLAGSIDDTASTEEASA